MAFIDDTETPMDRSRGPYGNDDTIDVAPERAALVKKLLASVQEDLRHWSKQLKRMRDDMKFAAGYHWPNQRDGDERMIVDITQRHVQSRTAGLYAKNPKIEAKRKERLEFTHWDGTPEMLEAVARRLIEAEAMGMPPMPDDIAFMRDLQEGMQRKKMLERLGKTLELLFQYSLDEQFPQFKTQAKNLIPRTTTCGVGYFELDYQRETQKRPDVAAKLDGVETQIAVLTRLQGELAEGEIDSYAAEIEQARAMMAALQAEPELVLREGLVIGFPKATRVIPHKRCIQLEGFVGADYVTIADPMTPDDIQETYGVNIGKKYTSYTLDAQGELKVAREASDEQKSGMCCVYRIFHRKHGLVYVICEGYPDFLQEPAPPNVKVDGFVPIIPLIFNRSETENDPFPKSDVRLLRPLQKEINRLAESLRQARIAAKPRYISAPGAFSEEEKLKLSSMAAHTVLEVGVGNSKIDEIIQQIKVANIDPNLYTPDPVYDAIMRVVGSQEANLGGTSGSTATETAVAEASRISSIDSNADDLDEALSLLARMAGQILLANMQFETVVKIVGKGAVWPKLSAAEIAEEMYLTIQAGSTGRPNRMQELANLERAAPFLLQTQGISSRTMARLFWEALDSKTPFEEFYEANLPSITALNGMKQIGTGDPNTDPNAQGAQGGDRNARPGERPGGAQAALPAPSEGVDFGGQQR